MIVAIIPLVIAVVGLLMFALAANPKVQQIGFAMFQCSFLVLCFVLAKHAVSLP